MLIKKEKTQYYEYALSFDYDQDVVEYCRYLKSVLGWTEFSYDGDQKSWRFKDPQVIKMLKDKFPTTQFGEGLDKEVAKYALAQEENKEKEQIAKEIKEMKVSTLEIKGIKGELYNYQKLGVEFFINSNGRAVLADSPGVGKSAQALGYVVHENLKRTLIICPASVKFSWENEIKKWTKLKSFIVESKTKFSEIPHDINIIIVNYDALKKNFNELMKYKFDICICDESQFLKNPSAIRSKAAKAIAKNIPKVLLLTGTPILSRPIELFNLLSIIDPLVWNNWYSYAVKYCEGKQGNRGFEAKGASNLEELKQKIGKYFLRRTKEEVLPELPPKIRTEVPMELSGEFYKQYKTAASDLAKYLRDYKEKKNIISSKDIQAEELVRINYLRQISSLAKIEVAKELIQNIIEDGEKILVFSCFNAPLLELQKYFGDQSVMIIGSTDVNERGEIVKKFQEDPKIKIFFGGVNSAGTGITLTAASNVLFIDYDWVPAAMEQALNRAHRPGAVYESLNIYQITSKSTIDEFMKKLLLDKQEIFDKLFEGKKEENKKLMLDEMVKDIEKNY